MMFHLVVWWKSEEVDLLTQVKMRFEVTGGIIGSGDWESPRAALSQALWSILPSHSIDVNRHGADEEHDRYNEFR